MTTRIMTTRLTMLVAALALTIGGTAFADGPSGSSEDPDNNYEVTCGSGTDTGAGIVLYAGSNGAEACSDDDQAPDGRVIATTDQGGYVAVDGDPSNGADADGYVRADGSGVTVCDGNGDATTGSCDGTTTTIPPGSATSNGAEGPPEGDPTDGQGEHGEEGCRGIDEARDHTPDEADPALDLVDDILTGDDEDSCEDE